MAAITSAVFIGCLPSNAPTLPALRQHIARECPECVTRFTPPGSLWERWEKAPDGVAVESCTIITTAANALVAELHDRMPVILPPDDYAAWLSEDSAAPAELLALLKPYRPDAMRAYPVSTAVNSPKNDTPECVEPAA